MTVNNILYSLPSNYLKDPNPNALQCFALVHLSKRSKTLDTFGRNNRKIAHDVSGHKTPRWPILSSFVQQIKSSFTLNLFNLMRNIKKPLKIVLPI